MLWSDMSNEDKVKHVKMLKDNGYSQVQIGASFSTTGGAIKVFCRRNNITDWPRGARLGNKNAEVDGLGKNTIMRLTRKIVIKSGRSLFKCERCEVIKNYELHRHHKDRNREHNEQNNIEVLCNPCHGKEHNAERKRTAKGTFAKCIA